MEAEMDEQIGLIQAQLTPGEKLVWSGRPKEGLRLRREDKYMIPFSLFWCGFAIFWNVMVWSQPGAKAPIPFKLFGLPFVLAGLYLVIGRFFVDARMRSRTRYGLTNGSIIIVTGRSTGPVRSLLLRTLNEISLTEKADGSGTITFGPQLLGGRLAPPGWPGSTRYAAPAFEMIEGVKKVYDLIRKTQKEAV